MFFRIDLNSEETLYSQLSNQIKYGIAKGYLKPGEDLPSVRRLASELGINLHTVAKAYSRLKEEGIIIINRSRGVKVSKQVLANRGTDYETILHGKITKLVSEGICHGIEKDEFMQMVEKIFDGLEGEQK